MALHLARRKQRLPSNPTLFQLFSNYSSDSKNGNAPGEKPSSDSSPLDDIMSRINLELGNPQEQHGTKPFTRSDAHQPQNRGGGLPDLAKNLAKFERRSTAPPPRDGAFPSRPPVSFEALFKQNAGSNSGQNFNSNKAWENLKNMSAQSNKPGMSLGSFKSSLKSMPRGNVVQGGEASPMSLFRREMEKRKGKESETGEMKTEFLTDYSKEELGEKLRKLRPEGNKEFSLQDLNERLVKLRQEKEKEKEAQIENEKFVHLRNMVENFKDSARKETDSQQNYNFLGYLGDVPEYKLHPPKEGLIDIYFHPDNFSSAEKMKIELTKVREEFKMSESDCGSARVQVAQLTTKIKHLSKALHKKDKHSRKGLMGMVQKRKKLLKYIRRTDWDSYCLVLSKLGLRDNPDYKF